MHGCAQCADSWFACMQISWSSFFLPNLKYWAWAKPFLNTFPNAFVWLKYCWNCCNTINGIICHFMAFSDWNYLSVFVILGMELLVIFCHSRNGIICHFLTFPNIVRKFQCRFSDIIWNFLSFLLWNLLSSFGIECHILTKNAILFNIPNSDRNFQSKSEDIEKSFVPENSGNFQKILINFCKGCMSCTWVMCIMSTYTYV